MKTKSQQITELFQEVADSAHDKILNKFKGKSNLSREESDEWCKIHEENLVIKESLQRIMEAVQLLEIYAETREII